LTALNGFGTILDLPEIEIDFGFIEKARKNKENREITEKNRE
jgi:hypothetical protein